MVLMRIVYLLEAELICACKLYLIYLSPDGW